MLVFESAPLFGAHAAHQLSFAAPAACFHEDAWIRVKQLSMNQVICAFSLALHNAFVEQVWIQCQVGLTLHVGAALLLNLSVIPYRSVWMLAR